MILPNTLSFAGAAALVNLWLFVRIVRLRISEKVIHGDGGHALLARRMRAHSNFIENAPLAIILAGLIELAGKGGAWLAYAASIYLLARVSHAIGMDSKGPGPARAIGMLVTLFIQTGLAVVAVLIAAGRF